MAWFEKKQPEPVPVEPTPEEKAAAARALLSQKLEKVLSTDPAFQVMTVDGIHWICPYTGSRIQAPFGYPEPARDYLLEQQPWTKLKPKTVEEIQQFRWLLFLKENMELEPSMRIFGADGRWLNPFNAQWVRLAVKDHAVTAEMLQELALILARCPEAQPGKMLDKYRLDEAVRSTRFSSQQQLKPVDQMPHGTTRVSGSRADTTSRIKKESGGGSLNEDMDRAERIIEKMLAPLPAIDGFGITLHYEPHSQVGGDFYECKEIEPGRFFICLADVTGHGVQGAMVVVAALKALRFILKQEKDLVEILARLNDEVKSDLLTGQFITMFAGILDVASRTFTCVCAGHHPSFLVSMKRNQVLEKIGNKGAALGLLSGSLFKRAMKPTPVKLEPGDTIIMYTDGLSEVHNSRGVEYGDWRLMGTLLGNIEKPYDEVVSALVQDARQFCSGVLEDDVTVVSLSIEMPKEPEQEEAR